MLIELDDFYNNGFGWICKRCERELRVRELNQNQENDLPRVWREGEAESKQPKLAAPLAKWLDDAQQELICPRCRTTESVNKA